MNPLSRAWTSLTGRFTNPGSDSFSIDPPPDFDMPPLITAVMARDIESVRQLLALGADTSAVDDLQYTSLIYAAMGGQEEIVLLLLASGADINAKSGNGSGMSALAQAVASGEEAVSKLLIARGAKTSPSELSDLGMVKYECWRIGYQFVPPYLFFSGIILADIGQAYSTHRIRYAPSHSRGAWSAHRKSATTPGRGRRY